MSVKKRKIEFEDFIDPAVEIQTGAAIDPQAKLLNFAKIKVAAIDPKIQQEVAAATKRIQKNLNHLKTLISQEH